MAIALTDPAAPRSESVPLVSELGRVLLYDVTGNRLETQLLPADFGARQLSVAPAS